MKYYCVQIGDNDWKEYQVTKVSANKNEIILKTGWENRWDCKFTLDVEISEDIYRLAIKNMFDEGNSMTKYYYIDKEITKNEKLIGYYGSIKNKLKNIVDERIIFLYDKDSNLGIDRYEWYERFENKNIVKIIPGMDIEKIVQKCS